MLADEVAQRRTLAPPVLGARGEEEDLAAEHHASAPVTGLPAERRVARDPPVGRAARAVDAGAADDGNRVALVRSRPQQPEDVVVDGRTLQPGRALESGRQRFAVAGNVHAAEVEDALCRRIAEPGLRDELPEKVHGRIDSDEVRVVSRSANPRDDVALQARRDELRLRVAAVDAENDLHGRRERTSHATCASAGYPIRAHERIAAVSDPILAGKLLTTTSGRCRE